MTRGAAITIVLMAVAAGCGGDRPTATEPPSTDAVTPPPATTTARESTIAPAPTTVPSSTGPTPVPTPEPTTRATATTVPSTFADRPPYPSCGREDSLSLDGMGPASRERQCLLDANGRGAPAELVADEVSPLLGGSASIVYRTNADRTVDLFIVGDPWQTIHCSGLIPDAQRVFAPVDCAEPIDLE